MPTYTKEQIAERQARTAEKVRKHVQAACHSQLARPHFPAELEALGGGKYAVRIEHNFGGYSEKMEEAVGRLLASEPHLMEVKWENYEGHLDWQSQHYMNPGSIVTFTVS